jgi:hypothetical protein
MGVRGPQEEGRASSGMGESSSLLDAVIASRPIVI